MPPASCRARPVGLDRTGKKTAAAVHQEVAAEIQTLLRVVFTARRKDARLDLEALELATRSSVHHAGTAVLATLLSAPHDPPSHVPCPCGAAAHYHDTRPRQLLTALGPVTFHRAYYVCPHCHHGQSPRDRDLDVDSTAYSPAVRRMMAVVGSETSFDQGREQLDLLAGIEVTAKAVERQSEAIGADIETGQQTAIHRAKQLDLPTVCGPAVPVLYVELDGTGIPTVNAETAGRLGRSEGQPAHTREVKLGCCFTQTTTAQEGYPIRDEDSTSYVAAIESAEAFGLRLYSEVWRRGWSRAAVKVVIADGAIWIWNLTDQHLPGAIQIVDLYHARQHLWELAAKLFPLPGKERQRWLARCLDRLNRGKIEALVSIFQQTQPGHEELAKMLANESEYFQRNAERMRYPAFRAQGLFVGSGVVEAGCKTVIGSRLKCSGMFWTVRGANAIIALRCCRLSHRFEDYWEDRALAA